MPIRISCLSFETNKAPYRNIRFPSPVFRGWRAKRAESQALIFLIEKKYPMRMPGGSKVCVKLICESLTRFKLFF